MTSYLSEQPLLTALIALVAVTIVIALLLPYLLKVPASSFWLDFTGTLRKTFKTPREHPAQTAALAIFLLLIASVAALSVYYFQNRDIVARVGGVVLTTKDLEAHDRVYNGVLRYQKSVDESVSLASRKEVLDDLIKVTKIELEAKERNVYPRSEAIEEQKDKLAIRAGGIIKLEALWPRYGWTETDFTRSVQIDLVKQSLEGVLVAWREAEFIALRWDVLPDRDPDVSFYKSQAQKLLKAKEAAFEAGQNIASLVNLCKQDKNILKYFPRHAIGSQQLANNSQLRQLQRTTSDKTNVLDKKILSMKVPTKSEIWCDEDACYLIRVVGGNQGTFSSLEEWLKTQ